MPTKPKEVNQEPRHIPEGSARIRTTMKTLKGVGVVNVNILSQFSDLFGLCRKKVDVGEW